MTSIFLGKVKPNGYKRKCCYAYVDFGFVDNKPFIKYQVWSGGKGNLLLEGNKLSEIDYLIKDKYSRIGFEKLMNFNIENLIDETLQDFEAYFDQIVLEHKYSNKVWSIIDRRGTKKHKKYLKNGEWSFYKTKTWINEHKVVYVYRPLSDENGYFVDIETEKIWEDKKDD